MKTKKLSNIGNVNVCLGCYIAIVAGDFTQLDYYYEPPEADKREQAIRRGIDRLSEHGQLVDGNDRNVFSKTPCECCETKKHGERREISIIGNTYPIIEKIISVRNEKQFKEIEGVGVDLQSANAVKTVWEALSDEKKPKYAELFDSEKMGIKGAIGYTWELVNRYKKEKGQ